MLRTAALALTLLALGAAPASARDPFTVTAADGTVYRATAEEMARWVDVAQRGGADRGRQARMNAFQLLVSYAWIRGEAAERGIAVTHEEVVREFRIQREQAFPNRRAYRRFLREYGQTTDDILFRIRMDMLSTAVREQVLAGVSVSEADVDAYLDEHGIKRFPERRDVRIVLTRRRGTAVAAKRELRAGATWSSVARRYSIDEASRAQKGRLPEVARGMLERALQRAVFAARARRVVGPVRTQFGYYVFRVTRIHPAYDMPIEDAREQARASVLLEKQTAALEAFMAEYDTKWRARTACAPAWRSQPQCS